MRVACAFVCAIGLVVGCDEGEGVVIDTTAENFCDQIADVACHNWYQCCTESQIEDNLSVTEPRTELECREDMTLRCNRFGVTLKDSIKAGRVTFDPAQLNECLGAIIAPEDTCFEIVTEVPWEMACEESAFKGTVALGGSCLFTHDCVGNPDNYCAPSQKCTAKPTAGLPCGTGCASAYYCLSGICQPKLGAGAMCTSTLQCVEDLYCDTNALPVPVCATKQPGGGPCSSSAGCISNQCVPGQCAGTLNSCYRQSDCPSRCAISGFSCTSNSACSTGHCLDAGMAVCTSDATCAVGVTCFFPELCVPSQCIGDPVCTNATLAVDYCEGTASIPVI